MIQRRLLVLITMALLASFGCGGSGTSTVHPPQQQNVKPAPPDSGEQAQRNVLRVTLPVWSSLAAGAEFDIVLSARCVDELFQGSGRLAYDGSVVRPVSCTRGAALPADNIIAAKLDTPLAASAAPDGLSGVVPFAFTGLPDTPGCGRCNGELLRLRFKLLAKPGARQPVQLLNTPEYLQLRGTQGQRLSFDLSTEAVAP